jgi:hypothetical protein
MFTYNETSQMQQRYAELNKPAAQTEGWTHTRPNAIDRALTSLKAMLKTSKPQTQQPATRKPAGAH